MNQEFKIEIFKSTVWTCQFYKFIQTDYGFDWEFVDIVTSESWSGLVKEIAVQGWIDKLNT